MGSNGLSFEVDINANHQQKKGHLAGPAGVLPDQLHGGGEDNQAGNHQEGHEISREPAALR